MEHVASAGWRGRIQRAADATVWPRLFGNCHTHRDTEQHHRRRRVHGRHRPQAVDNTALGAVAVGEFALGRAVKPV